MVSSIIIRILTLNCAVEWQLSGFVSGFLGWLDTDIAITAGFTIVCFINVWRLFTYIHLYGT